jgi:hypothetical protein
MSESKSLKALKAEAKTAGVKGYTKLSRDELIKKTADMIEQNAIASSLNVSTLITENKTVPEVQQVGLPVAPVESSEPAEPVGPVPEEKKTPKKTRAPRKEKAPGAPKKERKKGEPNKWQLHVKSYREANPGVSYKQAMTDAKATYQA